MSLREDFRNALGSIAAAVPEAVRTMRHGETEQGAVVQSSSRDFAEAVSDAAPAEAARYVANAADFPTLEQGAAVELGDQIPPTPCPSLRVFSNESTLHMRWPQYWSFSFSISPSNEHPGLIAFRMDWLDILAVQGMPKSVF